MAVKFQDYYKILGVKGQKYDQLGKNRGPGQYFTPPPGWRNVHFQYQNSPAGFDINDIGKGGFSDFFEVLFGERFHGAGRRAKKCSSSGNWSRKGPDQRSIFPLLRGHSLIACRGPKCTANASSWKGSPEA